MDFYMPRIDNIVGRGMKFIFRLLLWSCNTICFFKVDVFFRQWYSKVEFVVCRRCFYVSKFIQFETIDHRSHAG